MSDSLHSIVKDASNAMPLVSIITPSFNQGQFIRATIESVLNQEYPNIDYLVVDGGSTDDTLSILKEYGERIKWISEPDNGQTDAINKGIRRAEGEIIAYLNSDDIYLPGAISRVVQEFQKLPMMDFIYGDHFAIDVDGKIIDKVKTIPFDPRILLYDANFISQPASFYHRRLFDKIGLFNDELQCLMDYEFFLRAAHNNSRFKFIPYDFSAIRFHAECKTLGGAEDLGIKKVRRQINNQYIPARYQNPKIIKFLSILYRLKRYLILFFKRGRLDFMNLGLAYQLKRIANQ